MNDGMYTNLRNYLEEQSGLLRQILEELKAQGKVSAAPQPVKVPPEAVGPVTVETVETKAAPKAATKKPSKPGAKPNVNWNS